MRVAAVLLLGTALLPAGEAPGVLLFEKADLGRLPKGWQAARTGEGEGSVWKVVADPTAPAGSGYALAQTAEGPKSLFNLCVREEGRFRDVRVRVRLKAVGGKIDQGGGVVWRYQDADNYYVARYNPLEENFRVYRVVAGKRTQLGTAEKVDLPAGRWTALEVRMTGEQIDCWLAGKKYLSVRDATFPKAGRVGLWSKADARTRFDEFRAETAESGDE